MRHNLITKQFGSSPPFMYT